VDSTAVTMPGLPTHKLPPVPASVSGQPHTPHDDADTHTLSGTVSPLASTRDGGSSGRDANVGEVVSSLLHAHSLTPITRVDQSWPATADQSMVTS
jgi:hypothetical protein